MTNLFMEARHRLTLIHLTRNGTAQASCQTKKCLLCWVLMIEQLKKYLNVHLFLQDYYHHRKKQNPEFSYEVWAKELGASGKSYVRMMVLGHRPINTKMAEAFADNFAARWDRSRVFHNLGEVHAKYISGTKKIFFGSQLVQFSSI